MSLANPTYLYYRLDRLQLLDDMNEKQLESFMDDVIERMSTDTFAGCLAQLEQLGRAK